MGMKVEERINSRVGKICSNGEMHEEAEAT